ncbi:ABC transporter ATP-binding protein [Rhodovulum marinum]|uniref:ABC-type bacteriocin/lantibiotic exporter with double-glycine peptidase domain n=1 Tax=Rhodovulum marinum TaxID=320662 RepID=A0A4R2PTV3_9RHOB|nr:ABC transporter ATP-binding protein [Rhodovulum marinum]TCP39287.1 ABC-type bacteriocin/lantibiotic exporter with double-glycine peptidase domain [Rhodovulum marinum]
MTGSSIKKAWALLDAQERRNAYKLLGVMVFGAFASAAMVGSVFPFLTVLADPGLIAENAVLDWLYRAGGFTSGYGFLVALGLGAIAVILFSNIVLVLQTWAVARYMQMRVHSISRGLLAHYLAQPYDFFLGRHSGDMSTNILSEAQQVVGEFLRPLGDLLSATLTITAVVTTLLIADPVVASIAIGSFAAVYGAVTMTTRRYVRRMGQERALANTRRFRMAGEALGGIKDVKLLGREAAYLDRFSGPSAEMAQAQIGVSVLAQAPRYAIQLVAFGGIIVLCLVLLDPEGLQKREALGGILPLVGLLAFAGQRLMPELQKLYQSITQMTAGTAALDRVHADLTGGPPAPLDRTTPAPLGLRHALELEGVTYAYPGAKEPGLRDVGLTICAGERIGVVGASGAGKTTLADVVLGLLVPQTGTIRADGAEITPDTLRAWQQTVGYVPQDIFLTDASLSENIALGLRPEEIDAARVERAARIAQLHDFTMTELPDRYATLIGERGVRLSGGQRQRIGIARALYHDADLIVFDEATSALDNLTEREVMASIEALPGDKTILMIAHRLSTVKVCDRIVVMERGGVAGVGTWTDLMERNAAFRALAEAA